MRQSSVLAPRNPTHAGHTRPRAALIFRPEKGGTFTETRLAKNPTPSLTAWINPRRRSCSVRRVRTQGKGGEAGESRASVLPPRERLRDAYMRTRRGGGRCGDHRPSFRGMTASDAIRMGAWGKRKREGGDDGRGWRERRLTPGARPDLDSCMRTLMVSNGWQHSCMRRQRNGVRATGGCGRERQA